MLIKTTVNPSATSWCHMATTASAAMLCLQLDDWVADGVVEPGFAEATVSMVSRNPDWLDTSDVTVIVLGAGSEMGPFYCCSGGGRIVGVDLRRPEVWRRLIAQTRRFGGSPRGPGADRFAGGDVRSEVAQVAERI